MAKKEHIWIKEVNTPSIELIPEPFTGAYSLGIKLIQANVYGYEYYIPTYVKRFSLILITGTNYRVELINFRDIEYYDVLITEENRISKLNNFCYKIVNTILPFEFIKKFGKIHVIFENGNFYILSNTIRLYINK